MNNTRWKGTTIVAIAASAMVLASCSKASDNTASSGGGASSAAAPAASAAGSNTAAASGSSAAGSAAVGSAAGSSAAGSSAAASSGAGSSAAAATAVTGTNVEPGCTPTTKTKPYIAIVSKGFQQQFWQSVKKGADQAASKLGATITFDGPATEADIQPQLDMLKTDVSKKPDAVGFAALDSKAAEPILKQVQAAKIPVIAFDSGVQSDIPLTTAATDNKAAAGEAAKHMAQLVGNKGTVGLVIHDQTSQTGLERRNGFIEWMKKNAPGIKLLEPQYGGGDPAKSADITKSIIAGNPDIAGIYGSNEGSAAGVVQGVKESGKKSIKIVGFDSGQAQISAITDGLEAGAITQNPIGIGEQTVTAAMLALKCKGLPTTIDTGYYWYDKTNITDPKIAPLLYK
ncbi:MAG: ABC transporter substrate-binding protein [Actinomycetota bacterium]|nr:ABC transporter substrate-binding protein [Actinomycetota bacterium]